MKNKKITIELELNINSNGDITKIKNESIENINSDAANFIILQEFLFYLHDNDHLVNNYDLDFEKTIKKFIKHFKKLNE